MAVDINRIYRSGPSWLNGRLNRKGTRLILRGNSTWAGQPVVDTNRIRLRDGVTGVNINQAMAASWRIRGNKERNRIVFGDQAGAITKRRDSIINFGNDDVKDVLVFKNTVPGKPFNHAQRYVIKNMGFNDVIVLKNIGRKFRIDDVRNDGSLPGVPRTSFRIASFADFEA